jgi:hypothetical protein
VAKPGYQWRPNPTAPSASEEWKDWDLAAEGVLSFEKHVVFGGLRVNEALAPGSELGDNPGEQKGATGDVGDRIIRLAKAHNADASCDSGTLHGAPGRPIVGEVMLATTGCTALNRATDRGWGCRLRRTNAPVEETASELS